ncbi:MAG: hypothetical protein JST33_08630 [Actinobacteria bacterium]|nr:hypothetical protein [Actinomycetota bacterium]
MKRSQNHAVVGMLIVGGIVLGGAAAAVVLQPDQLPSPSLSGFGDPFLLVAGLVLLAAAAGLTRFGR